VLLPGLLVASVVSLDLVVLQVHLPGLQLALEVALLRVNVESEVHSAILSSALCLTFSLPAVLLALVSLALVLVLLVDPVD
jgi:hypothetical protein